jgi:hypothetical protein
MDKNENIDNHIKGESIADLIPCLFSSLRPHHIVCSYTDERDLADQNAVLEPFNAD